VKRLFWDIETSPNIMFSWRSGWKITLPVDNIIRERAIICICYKWQGDDKVHALRWNKGDDAEMLWKFTQVIERADEMVAHNGDNFDMKWYNGRHLINKLDPVCPAKTVDTLKIAKKHFYLNSNRLDYLGKILFGEGKIHAPFSLWKNIVLENSETDMRKMVRYCRQDVLLLERVWERLQDYETPSTHEAVAQSGDNKDRWMCPYCGSDEVVTTKTRATAKGMVQRVMKCKVCHRYYTIADAVHGWYLAAKRRRE
jgi:hypothetical protein